MLSKDLGIVIPTDLLCYKKATSHPISKVLINYEAKSEVIKDSCGRIICTKLYDENNEISKVVYYSGTDISKKCYYSQGKLVREEEFSTKGVIRKIFYDQKEQVICKYGYFYDIYGKVVAITKTDLSTRLRVKYGYDDLKRISSREIILEDTVVDVQQYKYDILDRIIEYEDKNQSIKIEHISPKNELIYYKIIDKMGNEILIKNNFDAFGIYKNTEVSLNGHSTVVIDKKYLDNAMLKKPYTSEDDLDIIISNLFRYGNMQTQRKSDNDISNDRIQINVQATTLPISIRKRLLYNQAVCA